ncbi:MAG: vitamin B12-dependent ribonucleotide reductase [Dehalococcoidales bacterium]|jgi:ribonucleoside-diphosphate reductase alpha chain|nr:vitamin B12-dependent ribonucleotide reductase [Dehalococcoidales bacterium]MDX9986774.1 vitamin B12-dependent ribonucleotide reductase [Dehalococcoidales bacterium]
MTTSKSVPKILEKMNLTSTARSILEKRYLKRDENQPAETPEEMLFRVASVVGEVETQYGKSSEETSQVIEAFYNMMARLEFMPNSPTLMNAGRDLGQLSACFVLPVDDSMEAIFDAIKHAAIIHKSGGGTGFSFSRLRPKNSTVRSTGGVASGPVSFMKVFNSATEAVKQGGTRRGANMGILRVDHPDIEGFIRCKEDSNEITNFNISVGITDDFMKALANKTDYDLIDPHTKKPTGQRRAEDIFWQIVDHAWENGEPGIVFLDRINSDNPTPALGEIEATNPCGEQPLFPNEACNLGSINLKAMVKKKDNQNTVDWEHLARTTRLAVRFLDNVIDANNYPLDVIKSMVEGNRKIGLGVMGFADMLISLGVPYDSEEAVSYAEKVMSFIQTEGRLESERLAQERGTFPNYEKSVFYGVRPVRNATVTTIAPTGTISMICGASSGVEPIFAVAYTKTVLDGTPFVEVNPLFLDYARECGFLSESLKEKIAESGSIQGLLEVPAWIQRIFVTAQEIDPKWHIQIQAAFQKYTDNAVSKTINFPHEATRDDIAEAYLLAYELNCKGLTVYRDGSREEQVLSKGTNNNKSTDNTAVKSGPAKGIQPRPRPQVTMGVTEKIKIGCGNLYVSVNADEQGICEIFTNTGRAGGCSSQSEATARLISISLRSGISVESIIEQIKGIRCPACIRRDGVNVTSCPDAIARVIKKYIDVESNGNENKSKPPATPSNTAESKQLPSIGAIKTDEGAILKSVGNMVLNVNACPDCNMPIQHESGCIVCIHCGYSKCE